MSSLRIRAVFSTLCLTTLSAVLLVETPTARTLIIKPDGSGDAPTIQRGIELANTGDTVLVECGTYYEYNIVMASGITLRSETGIPDCVTINARGLGRVLTCLGVDAGTVIEGIRFTGGSSTSYGGGAYFWGYSEPLLKNCLFRGNHGSYGGGVWCNNSSPVFDHCAFVHNSSVIHGAGLFSQGSAHPVLVNTIVAFNHDEEGIYCSPSGFISLECCNVFGNDGGDYVDCIASMNNWNGNFSADPLFCDASSGNLFLYTSSPCLPGNHPNGEACGLIGPFGWGCGPVATQSESWGRVKSYYR